MLEIELQQIPDAIIIAPPLFVIVPPLDAPYREIFETTVVAEIVGAKIIGAW